jgi:putative transposase
VLLRLAYLAVTNVFALLRLLPVSDRDKDVEILALRHQITVLERQLGEARPRFSPVDRAFLAALLHRLPRDVLGRFRLLVRPETVLRWHRDLLARRHAARSRPGRLAGRARSVLSACCCAWHGRTRVMWSWGLCERARWPSLSWCL